ncbi:hypothetical protein, partial [Paraburkholderia sp. RL18-085-BIA-A]
CVEVGVSGDLPASVGAVRAVPAIEVGRQFKRIDRTRGGQGGGLVDGAAGPGFGRDVRRRAARRINSTL